MAEDIFLKVRNYGPLTSGTSTLNGGFLRIPQYTVFIGDQGTGKSTVAKLFSTFSWLEKSFIRKTNDPHAFTVEKLQTLLANQNLPEEYLKENTELEFRGQAYTISFSNLTLKLKAEQKGTAYLCPQIIYFPSERNILSVMEGRWDFKGMPEMVYELAGEYSNAMKRFGRRRRDLFDGYAVEFDPEAKTSRVTDPARKASVQLANASSGLQSVAPLVVVSDYLSKCLKDDFLDRLKRTVSIRLDVARYLEDASLQAKLQDFFKSGLHDGIGKKDKEVLEASLGRYVNSCLWQIVEEPEQNLYPTSQVKIVNRLIENTGEGGKLLMTTHSPYILSLLNNYLFAFDRHEKFRKTIHGIPIRRMINYDKCAAYKMKDGHVESIMDDESRMIDAVQIDECSRQINATFDRLMEMEVCPK